MNAETAPAVRRRERPAARYVRPSDVRSLRMQLELGWRVFCTVPDHYGPGEPALMLVWEEA